MLQPSRSFLVEQCGTPAAASRLWTQVTLPNTGKITRGYDAAGRLTSTQLKHFNNTVLDRHDYLYNTRHERTKQTRADAWQAHNERNYSLCERRVPYCSIETVISK